MIIIQIKYVIVQTISGMLLLHKTEANGKFNNL